MSSPSPTPSVSPFSSAAVATGLDAMVVVDCVSTGANVAHYVAQHGFKVVAVFSGHTPASLIHMIDPEISVKYEAILEQDPSSTDYSPLVEKLKAITSVNIVAVLSGSELGVECADYLSNALNLPLSNSTRLSSARRDKYNMGEAVRASGVRAVKQARVSHWSQVQAFVEDLKPEPFKVVIKPAKSAGSDGVYLCQSLTELESKFNILVGSANALGHQNDCAVVQEYLQGTEYVVDTVSRNGEHKVVAVWSYDKRMHAGAAFVYFGMTPVACEGEAMMQLVEYQKKVLDALEIRNGPGHGEVIMTKTGPCLVEVGARPHGGEGTFIRHADKCWGYNQADAVVKAYASDTLFNAIPSYCSKLLTHSFKVYLVSYVSGVLKEIMYKKEIEALSSFMRFDAMPHPGSKISVTVDCFTMVGSVILTNDDKEQLAKDIAYVRSIEPTMFSV